jgi:hypothetical protein
MTCTTLRVLYGSAHIASDGSKTETLLISMFRGQCRAPARGDIATPMSQCNKKNLRNR